MKKDASDRLFLSSPLLKFISLILGIAAAYFLTIQSIKIELASKAEVRAVDIIDKKLTNIEVLLKEGAISKEQFYKFTHEVDMRLLNIEILLEQKQGDNFGK